MPLLTSAHNNGDDDDDDIAMILNILTTVNALSHLQSMQSINEEITTDPMKNILMCCPNSKTVHFLQNQVHSSLNKQV